ncbi:MBL fold metallo-hydrolase [Caldichromatium japonicum]|uniref:MBL fold metallo-hydrolase n=1 Tax=Caldichromatium japonicum TaxID=2699430 RepID=A0A6G7VGK5_9GAMM|nr:MBL fold metallo-hydrolase [Caldichromatium japonicum]QIK39179.1 MBL fold metallo-hydrolase [Caldichromatium japonicum]
MEVEILPVTTFEQNCTLLWCVQTRRAAIIDPGGEAERIAALIEHLGLEPERILLTHGHLDHVGASAELAQRYAIPIQGPHAEDGFLLQALPEQARLFGFPPQVALTPDRWLQSGERIAVGAEQIEVIHCPGHTPGHLVFYHLPSRLAMVGDVIFRGSIGRTDLAGGDHRRLIDSIRNRLFPLGDDVRFIPGHGPVSTLGEERRFNPFVRD